MARQRLRRFTLVVATLALLEGSLVGAVAARADLATRRTAHEVSRTGAIGLGSDDARTRAPRTSQERDEDLGSVLVPVERARPITAQPGRGRVVGTMPSGSRFYDQPIVAWVQDVSADGRFGLVTVPYVAGDRSGWIALRGLEEQHTTISVEADLSAHRITIRRGDRILFTAPAATGAPSSPTPAGHYFVTDRVRLPAGGSLGSFAFGISGIQPNLPPGWTGGDQLAIHGTNDPSSIGRSASAGCLRVSERVLGRLQPLLRFGTPVVIHG